MSTMVRCPSCNAGLKVPDQFLGKVVRCPRCREAVRTAAPQVEARPELLQFADNEESVTARAPETAVAPRAERLSSWDDEDVLPRRARKRRRERARRSGLSFAHLRWILGGVFGVIGAVLVVWLAIKVFRTAPPPTVADGLWQTVEVPNRMKVQVPGFFQRVTQNAGGVQMVMYMCQPDKDSVYGVGYMEGVLPPHRARLPANEILDDACSGGVANSKGGRELSRESIKLGSFPGKQVVIDVPQGNGQMIVRCYLAHGRLYLLMAGGRGFRPGQPNVKKLFDSFAILDKGDGAPAPADDGARPPDFPKGGIGDPKPPEPPPPPSADIFRDGPRHYLSDLPEFAVRAGPWPFTKNGGLGDGRNAIRVNGKPSPKGLGMHPPDSGVASAQYSIGRRAARFKAIAALNDTAEAMNNAAIFEVWGDGKRLWASMPLSKAGERQDCTVDVSGVDILELRVQASGSHFGLHAVWVEPRLLRAADTPDPAL